ncbi:MAG: FAD-binding protein, partial [Gordonibacter sp.]
VRGETACSRPLAENEKWMAKSLYLGVSGRMISPKVYFALGISGQMQHMVGVHNADIIVAVNKDQNAPVFNQADYGIVGDLHEVLPALTAKLA